MHSGEIELILAQYFNFRQNLIVPNISWGLHIHEVDLLIIKPSWYATEIEIKTSIADLKADLKKKHQHKSNKIRFFYFAVPKDIEVKALELIPERAGLIVIEHDKVRNYDFVNIVKVASINKLARKLTQKEVNHIYELASMRMWNLKKIIYKKNKKHV